MSRLPPSNNPTSVLIDSHLGMDFQKSVFLMGGLVPTVDFFIYKMSIK